MSCPRCKNPAFAAKYAEKGYCWWCSQEAMTTVCDTPGKGCGMRVCQPCFEGKILPRPAPPQLSGGGDEEEGFAI
jgi:hypothetical protein